MGLFPTILSTLLVSFVFWCQYFVFLIYLLCVYAVNNDFNGKVMVVASSCFWLIVEILAASQLASRRSSSGLIQDTQDLIVSRYSEQPHKQAVSVCFAWGPQLFYMSVYNLAVFKWDVNEQKILMTHPALSQMKCFLDIPLPIPPIFLAFVHCMYFFI